MTNTSSLGALVRCRLGQKREEEEGFMVVATVRQFALGMVRIEEEESTVRRRVSSRAWGRR